MRVSDIRYGKPTSIELRRIVNEGFEKQLSRLREAYLVQNELGESVILRIGDYAWEVEGKDGKNQVLLDQLMTRNLPRFAWIAAYIHGSDDKNDTVVVEVHEFPAEHVWDDEIQVGVDETVVEMMRKKRKHLISLSDAIDWLTNEMIITNQDEEAWVLISGNPSLQASKQSGFRIHGKAFAVDVKRSHEDKLTVTRVVEARRRIEDNEKRPILKVKAKLGFVDYTIAGRFRGVARSQLDKLVEDSESYLGLWRGYNELERKVLFSKARGFGWLKYNSCALLPNGEWRFFIAEPSLLEEKTALLGDGEGLELEAGKWPPEDIFEENRDELIDEHRRGKIFAGELAGYNANEGTLDLIVPSWGRDEELDPPQKGFVFLSIGGDRVRLRRREDAQSKIMSAECPMPQLGLLIEGETVPERRRKQEQPISAAAKKHFGGDPTDKQIEALRVALNTPDIALIQGPPGTGKTRLIAALLTRLSEIAEDSTDVSGRWLLTSYQHDAVENVANVTQVYGLPAVKIGRKKGKMDETDSLERWRRDTVEAVSAQLAQSDEKPLAASLRKCRDLAIGYLKAPSRNEDLPSLIKEIRDTALLHISPQLADELLELQQKYQRRRVGDGEGSLDYELAVKALRGLRTDDVAFVDDGPTKALKALKRLEYIDALKKDEELILIQAIEWKDGNDLSFLQDLKKLRDDLLDCLLPKKDVSTTPLVNSDVEAVFGNVITELREKVRSTVDGVDAVLQEYRDDLEADIQGARETISKYTVVLASTCQQVAGVEMGALKGEDIVFETVVVDEAARANPLDLFIPLSRAERRIVLVGDHRQLPHVLEDEIERDLDTNVNEKTREVFQRSLFERLFKELKERENRDGVKRAVTLDVQYRMHPVLGKFVSDTFYKPYGEEFSSSDGSSSLLHGLERYGNAVAAWIDIPLTRGEESRAMSKKRTPEAVCIAEEAHKILKEKPGYSVGVITFYSAQAREILSKMEPLGLVDRTEDNTLRIAEQWRETRDKDGHLKERLRVGTVDAFQGKEFDVVLLSMTRSNDMVGNDDRALRAKYGFLMLENRLCVAMSRQKRILIVVGDAGMLENPEAEEYVRGLVRFRELCEGEHGTTLIW